ncbi:hypothetical protein [Enterococcus rivorum]
MEFEKSGRNNKTGSYTLLVNMINLEGKLLSYSFSFWEEANRLEERIN